MKQLSAIALMLLMVGFLPAQSIADRLAELERGTERLSAVEKKVDDLAAKVDSLSAKIDGLTAAPAPAQVKAPCATCKGGACTTAVCAANDCEKGDCTVNKKVLQKNCPCSSLCTCGCNIGIPCACAAPQGLMRIDGRPLTGVVYYPPPYTMPMRSAVYGAIGGIRGGACAGGS